MTRRGAGSLVIRSVPIPTVPVGPPGPSGQDTKLMQRHWSAEPQETLWGQRCVPRELSNVQARKRLDVRN